MVPQHIGTLVLIFGSLEVGKINFLVSKMANLNHFLGDFFKPWKNLVNILFNKNNNKKLKPVQPSVETAQILEAMWV